MKKKPDFIFSSKNYVYLAISSGIILLGFFLLSGSSNTVPSVFNSDIYSFRRISLAPFIIFAGYTGVIFSIFQKTDKTGEKN